jgi:hypothetical protein
MFNRWCSLTGLVNVRHRSTIGSRPYADCVADRGYKLRRAELEILVLTQAKRLILASNFLKPHFFFACRRGGLPAGRLRLHYLIKCLSGTIPKLI